MSNDEVVCSSCGKEMSPDEVDKEWRRCAWCKKPICFDCAKYIGVRESGLYQDYIKVVRLCKKCYPEKKLAP